MENIFIENILKKKIYIEPKYFNNNIEERILYEIKKYPIIFRSDSERENINYKDFRITNFEMETSVIYGLSKLLGHEALSLNAIIANRANGDFSKDPKKTVEILIKYALERIVNI